MTATTAGAAASRAGCILATSLGLDAEMVKSQRLALPATRFAVGAYYAFCADRTLLEAVASSLTELFSPVIIGERVPAMLAKYDYVTEDTLAYFRPRPGQASRDSDFALAYVLDHADTPEQQQAAIDALVFKCDILWAMLDALDHAYGEAGHIPPGAFRPEDRAMTRASPAPMVATPAAVPLLPRHVRHAVRPGAPGLGRAVARAGVLARTTSASTSCGTATAAARSPPSSRRWRRNMTRRPAKWSATSLEFLQEWSDRQLVRL